MPVLLLVLWRFWYSFGHSAGSTACDSAFAVVGAGFGGSARAHIVITCAVGAGGAAGVGADVVLGAVAAAHARPRRGRQDCRRLINIKMHRITISKTSQNYHIAPSV